MLTNELVRFIDDYSAKVTSATFSSLLCALFDRILRDVHNTVRLQQMYADKAL